ncbi:MAG: TlpA family protein disulfide reductase [Polaromonas sp.]
MLTFNIGPFPLPASQLALLLAGLAALGVGRWVEHRQQGAETGEKDAPDDVQASPASAKQSEKTTNPGISNTLSDMLLVGLLAARGVFVLTWLDSYRGAPWAMLDVRDGGFTPWAGALAALLVALWQGARQATLRKPLVLGLAVGMLTWGALLGVMRLTGNADDAALPAVRLTTLAGESVDLAALAAGRPLVVNLWASWCPPCRREMPVLAAAQQRESGVRFVFANQGEDAAAVLRYLSASGKGLKLSNVVFDPTAALGRAVGSKALPTTLFYDASGRRVDTHLGELSAASLASKLQPLRASAPHLPAAASP